GVLMTGLPWAPRSPNPWSSVITSRMLGRSAAVAWDAVAAASRTRRGSRFIGLPPWGSRIVNESPPNAMGGLGTSDAALAPLPAAFAADAAPGRRPGRDRVGGGVRGGGGRSPIGGGTVGGVGGAHLA